MALALKASWELMKVRYRCTRVQKSSLLGNRIDFNWHLVISKASIQSKRSRWARGLL